MVNEDGEGTVGQVGRALPQDLIQHCPVGLGKGEELSRVLGEASGLCGRLNQRALVNQLVLLKQRIVMYWN